MNGGARIKLTRRELVSGPSLLRLSVTDVHARTGSSGPMVHRLAIRGVRLR